MKKISIIIGIILLASIHMSPINDTDINRWNRSGMQLYTDSLTGCQYLEAGMIGGITPRLDRDGKHICIPVY